MLKYLTEIQTNDQHESKSYARIQLNNNQQKATTIMQKHVTRTEINQPSSDSTK